MLTGNLAHYLAGVKLPAGFSGAAGASPVALAKLPAAVHSDYIQAVTASLHPVFLWAVPFGILGFAMTWLLKEVPLRKTVHATGAVSVPLADLEAIDAG